MSFGRNPYGTTPYGGAALVSGGISLVSSNPAVNGTGVPTNGAVQFLVNAPAEFDDQTLSVKFNGTPVIYYSEFQPGFNGTIAFDGQDLNVTISTHPVFPDGNSITVDIEVLDLAGVLGAISYVFHTGGAVFDGAETLTLSEDLTFGQHATLAETLTLTEGMSPFIANANEAMTMTETATIDYNAKPPLAETLSLTEEVRVGALFFGFTDSTTIHVDFPEEMDLDGAGDPGNFYFETEDGFPITVISATPIIEIHHTGSQGQVVETDPGTFHSHTFDTVLESFTPGDIGRYIFVTGSPSSSPVVAPTEAFQITSALGSTAFFDRPMPIGDAGNGTYVPGSGFVPGTGQLQWAHTTGAVGVTLKVTEGTNGKTYLGSVRGLRTITGRAFGGKRFFPGFGVKPQVTNVQFFPEDGVVLVSFNEPMRIDEALLSPTEYEITGPTTVSIRTVTAIDAKTVALGTAGLGPGTYSLTVNATGTPKDEAGNPIDPLFNLAVFGASTPLTNRSIFTDKGPIAKPPLTLQSGSGGTIQTFTTTTFGPSMVFTSNEVLLPGGAFTSAHVGLRIELGNSTTNGGTYKILSVLSGTRLKLQASFHLPDANNGSITWKLIDPRTGEIADDPADVTVRVNGSVVNASAVIGLLGQIVLPAAPGPTDDVKVDYSIICNPTIEFRRLNSKEFRLNNWFNDAGHTSSTQHSYRYRNVTVQPATFVPDDIRADLVQPLLRELHYHAFERAYSVALNDPNLLVLNTPIHRIAYPPLSRQISSTSVSYLADVLPENDATPWERKGVGIASVSGGVLTVQDNTGGPFPTGNPLFWTRGVDLTFPHVFAATWRMKIDSTTPQGVFTGIAVGWSNDLKALVLGYLDDGGVKKIGFLKKGFGNDPSSISAWTGALLGGAFAFDWSVLHSYRLFRGRDGVIKLFVDGEIVESLIITEDELPYLEELNDPFDQVQGAFFGSLSRDAVNVSTWDFVRYLVLPTNPAQSVPAIFSSYEGDIFPENNPTPWTPVGYHGNESLLGGSLILDSTSATTAATEVSVGLVGGDFRGFNRIEPLLLVSSDVVLDINVQLRTLTHGVAPNALMAAIDDGDRLTQLCFFPFAAQPKRSYPGRSLPQDATPNAWLPLGSATVEMIGRTLRITDTSAVDGRVYYTEDLAPISAPSRVIETAIDYFGEFKAQVVSFTPDGTPVGFCGATFDIFDGTRAIGVMLRQTLSGTNQVAFHSDGSLLGLGSQFDFNWNDGATHVYRIAKSTGGDLVSLFIDNVLIGTYPYSSFSLGAGLPTISFGSATGASIASKSVVDWYYVNTWRAQPSNAVRYVGIWKGKDPNSLTGYYLPLKTEGRGAVAGNALTNLTTNFVAAGVAIGDHLVIDLGDDKGVYTVATVGATTLTFVESFPVSTGDVGYRIPKQTDWTTAHKFRIVRDPGGSVTLLIDSDPTPLIRLDYNETVLPSNSVGVPFIINRGLPSVTWGAFDPENLSQSAWDFVRYGITRSPTELRIVPHHQFLNQRNVMASPEHLTTSIVHGHTQFSSASTGIPYPWQDFTDNPANIAFTKLNEGTPLVPSTQTYEVRRPVPVFEFVSGLNRPEDVLNNDGDFLLNDGAQRSRIIVPNDVLYNCLEVTEQTTGEAEHIAPFSDECNPIALKKLNWTKEVCGVYDGAVLPELDPNFGTPWVIQSDVPGDVSTTAFSGILTYSTGVTPGNNTIYRNLTPLTDPVSLTTRVDFRFKVLNDASSGLGDTGIRVGFNAFGLTAALAFVTTPLGDREVRILDLNTDTILGAAPFDFLDGAFHVYRLEKNVVAGTLELHIDP